MGFGTIERGAEPPGGRVPARRQDKPVQRTEANAYGQARVAALCQSGRTFEHERRRGPSGSAPSAQTVSRALAGGDRQHREFAGGSQRRNPLSVQDFSRAIRSDITDCFNHACFLCGHSALNVVSQIPRDSMDTFWMVRQEKLSQIEGESPSRLNMNDNT